MEKIADRGLQPGVVKGRRGDDHLVAVPFDVPAVTNLAGDTVHGRLVSFSQFFPGVHCGVMSVPYLYVHFFADFAELLLIAWPVKRGGRDPERVCGQQPRHLLEVELLGAEGDNSSSQQSYHCHF